MIIPDLMSFSQLKNAVYTVRREVTNGWEDMIHREPLNSIKLSSGGYSNFLQFDNRYHSKPNEMKRMIGFAHSELLMKAKQPRLNVFYDCTFKCVPSPFEQLMVMMIYDHLTSMYIPLFHVLLQDKTEATYHTALSSMVDHIKLEVGKNTILDVANFTCDFELALVNAGKRVFPGSKPLLCFFHYKQANWKKLREYHVPDNIIYRLMGGTRRVTNETTGIVEDQYVQGLLDLLTTIPIEEITKYGIPYIQQQLESDIINSIIGDSLTRYWSYYIKTWLKLNNPETWNISSLIPDDNENEEIRFINRTNNGLERYNRSLNDEFGNAHPNIIKFVEVIAAKQMKLVEECNMIMNKSMEPPVHKPPTIPVIPTDYPQYKINKIGQQQTIAEDTNSSLITPSIPNSIVQETSSTSLPCNSEIEQAQPTILPSSNPKQKTVKKNPAPTITKPKVNKRKRKEPSASLHNVL